MSGILDAQADFSVRLIREVAGNSSASTVLSPISIALALSLAYAGAEDETREEFDRVFAAGQNKEQLHGSFKSLMEFLNAGNKSYTLETANQVYFDSKYQIKDAYKKLVTDFYGGNFESLDFGQAAATAQHINEFVEKKTRNKIKDLIDSSAISADVKMLLVNAIYYKGNWKSQFDKNATNDKDFHVDENSTKSVRMMYKKFKVAYFEDKDVQVVGIPYIGDEIFFYGILPTERFGLKSVLEKLDGKRLMEYLSVRHQTEAIVELPTFKINSQAMLSSTLKKLGFSQGFTDGANFRGINENEPLKIDEVIHKAFIETNEEGSEAAAATGVTMRLLSAMPMEQPPHFLADHPFLFVLATKDSQVLFIGMVNDF